MSVIGSNILAGASGQGGGYNLTRSLRFRSSASAYLNRTPASAGNRKTWTWSAWVKRGQLGNGATDLSMFSAGGTTEYFDIRFNGNDQLFFFIDNSLSYSLYTSSVFRDPSAWYHIVVTFDTTQATASNRAKLYVNGVLQPLAASSYPAQNYDGVVNSTVVHSVGRRQSTTNQYFDGYITEVNFIDGQALTPSSFGETSATTGVWQPKKYAGTYGTNGFYLPFTSSQYGLSMFATTGTGFSTFAGSFVSGDPTGTQVNLPANSTNLAIGTGDFTVEGWVNTSVNGKGSLIGIGTVNTTGSLWFGWEDNTTTYVRFGATDVVSTGLSLSSAGWVHLAVTRSGSTVRLYKNGSLVGSGTSSANLNLTDIASIGGYAKTSASAYTLQGSLSNVRLVVGTALYTGSTYTVPTSALTAISGTQLLTLQNSTLRDNSANNYGLSAVQPFVLDASGNANNWQPNGINVTAVDSTYDSMTDVPTLTSATASNFNVLNPLSVTTGTVSAGNLQYVGANASKRINGTLAVNSGKWYWEVTLLNAPESPRGSGTAYNGFGFGLATTFDSSAGGTSSTDWINLKDNGYYKNFSNANTDAGVSFSSGDVLAIAVDLDANTFTFYRNNSSLATGTLGVTAGTQLVPAMYSYNGSFGAMACNFGQRPFAYTPPTGYVALNTFNLPTPTIGATASSQANKYMDVLLYTGDSTSNRALTGLNFQPDFMWSKSRSNAYGNKLYDAVRGVSAQLVSNDTAAESTTGSASLVSFNNNGVTIGNDTGINGSGATFVDWFWKANGSGSSNTAGSITSTVSANTTSGFSVVTYTGNGTGGATVGHGLGVAPKMLIVKNRVQGTYGNWNVWHTAITGSQYLSLNLTDAVSTNNNRWNGTIPTSTVFSLGADSFGNTNKSGDTYVAYVFSDVQGYQKIGSYTGNGSTDGTFIYTGFKPKFIIIKRTDAVNDWVMYDATRNTYNEIKDYLEPNTSDAESVGTNDRNIDILSNGFKCRFSGNAINGSGGTFIYLAIAETPTKFSLAR